MGLNISVSMSGLKELNTTFQVMEGAIKDLRPAWKEMERYLERFQKNVFLNKGAGKSPQWFKIEPSDPLPEWQELTKGTKAQKRRNPKWRKWEQYPLIRSGNLMNAYTKKRDKNAVRVKLPLRFVFGINESTLKYATYHHLGKGNNPVRKVLRLPSNFRRVLEAIIQKHLARSGQLQRGIFGKKPVK